MSDLPEAEFLYISSKTPLINVDLLVINEFGEVLLSWRDDEFCGTGWHIPGGIVRHGESMRTRIEKTSKQELGFIPFFEDNPCKITEIFLNQEYRNHFISHLFKGRCLRDEVKIVEVPRKQGDLRWFNDFPREGIVYSQVAYTDYLKNFFEKIQYGKS